MHSFTYTSTSIVEIFLSSASNDFLPEDSEIVLPKFHILKAHGGRHCLAEPQSRNGIRGGTK